MNQFFRLQVLTLVLLNSCVNSLEEPADFDDAPLNEKTFEGTPSDVNDLPAHSFHGDTRHYSHELAFSATERPSVQRRQRVWLSFDGLTLNDGRYSYSNAQDDVSPILEVGEASIPSLRRAAFANASVSIDAIDDRLVELVRDYFARYDIEFVTTRPNTGDYTTVAVGGTPAVIGINDSGVLGIAPLDGQNQNVNDIDFVFSEIHAQSQYTLEGLALTIVHELAHSFGLRHVVGTTPIMSERLCRCAQTFGSHLLIDGTGIQDDHALLSSLFFEKPQEPEVSCAIPGAPTIASEGSTLNEEGGCLSLSGQSRYWRSVSDENAFDNHYFWTGAIVRDEAVNAATFLLNFQSAGRYEVQAFIPPDAQSSENALYLLEHREGEAALRIDQRAQNGFVSLGVFEFNESETYSLVIGDNTGEPSSSSKRVLVDSIKVVPRPIEEPDDEEPDDGEPVDEEPVEVPSFCDRGNANSNDTFSNASLFAEDIQATRCSARDDYYRFEADENCTYIIELEHRAAEGDLDLNVLNANEQPLGISHTDNDIEKVVQGGVSEIYVRVSASDNTTESAYRLTRRSLCRENASCPLDDANEPNDTFALATPLYSNDAAIGMTCDNADHFRVFADSQCETRIRVEFDHAKGDIDAQLLNEEGALLARGFSVNDNEEIVFQPEALGFYDLLIYGYAGAQNDYRVSVERCEE